MEARVDFDKYPNAAKMARNLIPLPQGGMTRRPASRYVAEVKTNADATIVIPFEFNEDTAYMIEHGDQYMRFYKRQARLASADVTSSITNGTFDSNITGWDDRSTGSAAITHDATNSRLQLTGASDGIAWAEQDVTTAEAGTAHTIRFTIAGFGGGKIGFQVGSATTLADDLAEIELGVGEHTITFTPSASPYYIQFRNQVSPVRNMWIDDVSILDNAAVELTSPYAKGELAGLRTFQAGDIIYCLHSDHAPRKIERRGDKSWSIVEAFFEDGPWLDENPDTDLDQKLLLDNALFENGTEGWATDGAAATQINHDATRDVMIMVDRSGAAPVKVRNSVAVDTTLKHVIHFLLLDIGTVTLNLGTSAGGSTIFSGNFQPSWQSVEFTPTGATLHIEFQYDNPFATAADPGIEACLIYDETAKLLEASATSGEVTITALGFTPFQSSDVGRLLRLAWPGREPGYGVITAFTSSTSVTMLVLRTLASTTPTEGWRFGAWGGDQGYPRTMGLFDSRLALARTTESPQALWFSQTNDLQNMRPDSFSEQANTVEDDDAIAVTLNSKKIDPIFWISGQNSMIIGTAGGQWVVSSRS